MNNNHRLYIIYENHNIVWLIHVFTVCLMSTNVPTSKVNPLQGAFALETRLEQEHFVP